MNKYKLTKETKVLGGITLYRIIAVSDFANVKAGELGGFIEKENNLSQDGSSWVFDNARVFGDAQVCGDARVYGNALVCGDARVFDNARVFGNAWVFDDARVYGNAQVYGNALVCGNAWVYGNAQVYGNALVCGNAWVYGNAQIFWVSNIGSRFGTTTFFLCKDKKIRVKCGCFYGDLDEFSSRVQATHGGNRYGETYRLAIEMAMSHIVIPEGNFE